MTFLYNKSWLTDSLHRLSFAILLGRDSRLLTKETAEMRLVLEAEHGRYLFNAFTAVAQCYLSRPDDFVADELVRSLSRKAFAYTRKVFGSDAEEARILVDIKIGLRRVVKVLHELAKDVLARAVGLVQQFFVLKIMQVVQVVGHRSKEQTKAVFLVWCVWTREMVL